MAEEQEGVPSGIQIAPLPTTWGVAVATMQVDGRANPEQMVAIQFITPQGSSTFFFDGTSACRLGAAIMKNGRDVMAYESVVHKRLILPEGV